MFGNDRWVALDEAPPEYLEHDFLIRFGHMSSVWEQDCACVAVALMTIERQVLVDGANGSRTFPDCGRNSFGRSGTDVSDREQSRTAGLERQRAASQRLPCS